MPSKFDLLRQGHAVEIEPGLSGKLNKDQKTLELSSGEVLNVGHNKNFFPSNAQDVKLSKQREYAEKSAKGGGGEFFHQYTSEGIPGSISDIGAYLTQSGDEYATRKQAQNQVSERISEESPYISGAATGANIATDIALTRGMSALKAAPLLTAGSAGSRLLTEPGEVVKDSLIAAGGGYILDKATGGLSKIAARRGAARALPGQQHAVRQQNVAGQQAVNQVNAQQTQNYNTLKQNIKNQNITGQQAVDVANAQQAHTYNTLKQNIKNQNITGQQAIDQANAQQMQQFNVLQQNVKNSNQAKLQQHQTDLNMRQNQILQEEQAFEKRQFERGQEVIRLKNKAAQEKAQHTATYKQSQAEYKVAKESVDLENKRMNEKFKQDWVKYEEDLKKMPELQKQAQAEHSANVVRTAEEIEKSFPKNSRFATEDLGINDFIEQGINITGLAGTREATQARRIINSLFPEGERIGGRELSKRYKALEDSILRANPDVQRVLNEFKQHLGQKLPSILEDSVAFAKISPLIINSIDRDVNHAISSLELKGKGMESIVKKLANTAIGNARATLREELNPKNFVQRVQSGELAQEIANKVLTIDDFLFDIPAENIAGLRKTGILKTLQENAKKEHSIFVDRLSKELQNRLARYEIKAMSFAQKASQKFRKDIKGTYGIAEPVNPPNAPIESSPLTYPNAPTESAAFVPPELPLPAQPAAAAPPIPPKPNLTPIPPAPIPQAFNPALTPAAPAPQTFNPSLVPPAPAPQTFNPLAEPTLVPAQGIAERMGDVLEKPLLTGGRGAINNPLVKLGGLKYLLGKAALPAEAAYLGMKGLTSPTAAGQVARMTFKQGGIQAITQWAEKYPSFHDGILESPQDRRSLTKEVEDAYDIPIEQKAVIQSKINRGKPLQERI